MANELMTLEQASREIDKIVLECVPLAGMQMTTFSDTLKLAEGIKTLRQVFLNHPGIKEIVTAMQDTKLGFLTDRSPSAVARSQGEKKLTPYTYSEVAECCIEAMLKGFRITNNEFNIISKAFYPAKNGKYRKIMEHPDVAEFDFTNTSPAYEQDFKYAKVKCFASWKQKGKRRTIGLSDPTKGKEDTLIFRIRVNAGMGEDAVIGKALSKLFGRVLSRIEGRVLPESTDIEFGEGEVIEAQVVNGSGSTGDLTYKIKAQGKESAPGPEKPPEPPPNQDVGATSPPDVTKETETTNPSVFRDEWVGLRTAGYSTYVHKNRKRIEEYGENYPDLLQEMKDKWAKLYKEPWPFVEQVKAQAQATLLDTDKAPLDEATENFMAEIIRYHDVLVDKSWSLITDLFGMKGKDIKELANLHIDHRPRFLDQCKRALDKQSE